MAREPRSLQDLIRDRQQSSFIGRQGQLAQYQENFGFPIDDERRRFLFNIHGDAGVGKTYLTKQLRQIAHDSGAVTAYIDDAVRDVTSTMIAIGAEFSRAGTVLAEFEKRASAYRARRQELESDPQAPDGIAAFLTKTAVTIGYQAARDVPIAGSLLAPVDPGALAEQVNRARVYLVRKFNDHADVRLLLSPVAELTPVFVSELNQIGASRPIALFFDTYERTAPFLDQWLRDLYSGTYGSLPATLVTTVSGQNPLNPNLWGEYLSVITDLSLEPFSDAEARQYLASKNICDERTIQVILTLSGRLPMWLATLADARPDDPFDIGDPAGDAVERFLKWEDDPVRRRIAVTAALPRTLNQDVLATITDPSEARDLFGWLCGLPFVTRQDNSWRYHDVVRSAMLRLKRAQSPNEWRAIHSALSAANAEWATNAASSTKEDWANPSWIDYKCEEVYHQLCADPVSALPPALSLAVRAAHSTARARQWARMLAEAGLDTANIALRDWGTSLEEGIKDGDLIQYLTRLITDAHLNDVSLAFAFAERGTDLQRADRYDEALADFSRAVALEPTRSYYLDRRGTIYRLMGRYEEALADFNRTIEMNPSSFYGLTGRALTYTSMGSYEEALADLNRAIELGASGSSLFTNRGITYQAMKRYEEALADFTRAIELDPQDDWAFTMRGITYKAMERYEEALADFTRAIELDPQDAWGFSNRGLTYRAMERYEESLTDFTRAIELNPQDDTDFAYRGLTYRTVGRYEEALADLTRAIELDSKDGGLFADRGLICTAMGRYEEALANFDAAIELDPHDAAAFGDRAEVYQALGRYEETLADFTHAINLTSENDEWYSNQREETYQTMTLFVENLAELDRAVELDPNNAQVILRRGQVRLLNARYEEGKDDLRRAVELDADIRANLVHCFIPIVAQYLRKGESEKAVDVYDAVVSVIPADAYAQNNRAFCLLPINPAAALVELEKANELGYADLANLADRVLALHLIGRTEEAVALGVTEEAQSKIPSGSGLMWILHDDRSLQLSAWIDIREYIRSLLVKIRTIDPTNSITKIS